MHNWQQTTNIIAYKGKKWGTCNTTSLTFSSTLDLSYLSYKMKEDRDVSDRIQVVDEFEECFGCDL